MPSVMSRTPPDCSLSYDFLPDAKNLQRLRHRGGEVRDNAPLRDARMKSVIS